MTYGEAAHRESMKCGVSCGSMDVYSVEVIKPTMVVRMVPETLSWGRWMRRVWAHVVDRLELAWACFWFAIGVTGMLYPELAVAAVRALMEWLVNG